MLIGPKIEGRRGRLVLEELPTTLGAASGAAFEEALELNPTRAIGRIARLARERGEIGEGFFEGQFPDPFREPPSRVLPAEEANRRFAVGDLKFSEPTPEAVARMKHDFKRREIRRRDVLARGPGGVIGTVVPLGAALVASAIDPLNVASAFVPVVSQARTAQLVARFGKTGARLVRGGIEGAVGTALLEPLVLAGASAIEADFGITDAMLDIMFGTVLGGGLHVGLGRLADFIRRQRPEMRRAALKAAVAQAAEGRTVDVESVFRAELLGTTSRVAFEPDVTPRIRGLSESTKRTFERRAGQPEVTTERVFVPETPPEPPRGKPRKLSVFLQRLGGLNDVGGDVRSALGTNILPGLINLNKKFKDNTRVRQTSKRGLGLDDAASNAQQAGFFSDLGRLAEPDDLIEALRREQAGEILSHPDNEQHIRFQEDSRAFEESEFLRERSFDRMTDKSLDEIATREERPERDGASDFDAADEAERMLERSTDDPSQIDAKAEADEMEARTREDSGLPEDIDFGHDLVERADSYGRAARAAALCLSRKP